MGVRLVNRGLLFFSKLAENLTVIGVYFVIFYTLLVAISYFSYTSNPSVNNSFTKPQVEIKTQTNPSLIQNKAISYSAPIDIPFPNPNPKKESQLPFGYFLLKLNQ